MKVACLSFVGFGQSLSILEHYLTLYYYLLRSSSSMILLLLTTSCSYYYYYLIKGVWEGAGLLSIGKNVRGHFACVSRLNSSSEWKTLIFCSVRILHKEKIKISLFSGPYDSTNCRLLTIAKCPSTLLTIVINDYL